MQGADQAPNRANTYFLIAVKIRHHLVTRRLIPDSPSPTTPLPTPTRASSMETLRGACGGSVAGLPSEGLEVPVEDSLTEDVAAAAEASTDDTANDDSVSAEPAEAWPFFVRPLDTRRLLSRPKLTRHAK